MNIKNHIFSSFLFLYLLASHNTLQATPWAKELHKLFDNATGFGVPATDPELDKYSKDFPTDAPLSHTGKTLLTYNRFGFDALDPATIKESWICTAIIEYAKNAGYPLADIGGGYGRLVKVLVSQGATIIYNDLDFRHLMHGLQQISAKDYHRLYLNNKRFPNQTDFPDASLSGVILHRVIHFLSPEEIEAGFKKIARWLVPGGKLFIVVLPPHHGEYREKVLPAYDKAWAEGNPWPGDNLLTHKILPEQAYGLPKTLHVMDQRPLTRALEKFGFVVEKFDFISMKKFCASARLRDGKEQFGLIAHKI
ncbi:class I SAM-dependent methyltransferase [Candidatus Finniella inopinata]|uniref:Class I SAM-dependent methyltransferase n=1 Tax=Candidatus Finniella inopinata TaxID=1696036 RepID=A0A4Q7DL48_9PROT|nr:methyltransferase domain-containing protein [Candidatus Finniella inopinata]RZI47069.1 class I SAM-dependent methyltransferase [Candidatus Finniella inopinata]